jgi:hypothetical protein
MPRNTKNSQARRGDASGGRGARDAAPSVQEQVDTPVSQARTARPITRGGSSGGRGACDIAPSVQEQRHL